jgi:transposase
MVRRVIEDGLTLAEAAEAAGVSVRTAGKWARRYRAEGEAVSQAERAEQAGFSFASVSRPLPPLGR